MTIAIVGAGMAGLSCAEALVAAGHEVRLFDKGQRPGGRMATRRLATPLGTTTFDHGAQYFTARDGRFGAKVAAWGEAGLVAAWPAAGSDAFVGTPTMATPLARMAEALAVRWSARVEALRDAEGRWRLRGEDVDDELFDAVVVAVPAEQAASLLAAVDPLLAARAAAARSEPCWTLMVAFGERLGIATDVLRGGDAIGWAARDAAKPGRGAIESWVIQAGPAWSRAHLEDQPGVVAPALLQAFASVAGIGVPEPVASAAHRWRFARSGRAAPGVNWNPDRRLGVCGDWLLGPRVECAWLAGAELAMTIGSGQTSSGQTSSGQASSGKASQ